MEAHNTEQLIAHSEDSCEAAGSPVQVIDAHIRFLVNWYPFTVASSLIKAAGVCVTQLVCVCVTQLVCVCNTADVCVCNTAGDCKTTSVFPRQLTPYNHAAHREVPPLFVLAENKKTPSDNYCNDD